MTYLIDAGFMLAGGIIGTGLTMVSLSRQVATLTKERDEARAVGQRQFDMARERLDLVRERNATIDSLRAELRHWRPERGQGGRFLKAGRAA